MTRHLPLALALLLLGGGALQLSADDKSKPAKDLKALKPAEVKFKVRAYCYGASKIKDEKALGGFGGSKNFATKITKPDRFKKGELSLVAVPSELRAFAKVRGFALYLANRTGETVAISASDSRLSILREARDKDGKWKPIEYAPSSWCGNSYHRLLLADGLRWEFKAPEYAGPFETEMRFALTGVAGRKDKPIYSNVFKGKIHPEQFTGKQGHTPNGLMDPYNE